jgi:transcriptional regulator GlxA family with amidase domain
MLQCRTVHRIGQIRHVTQAALLLLEDCFASGPFGVADMLMAANHVAARHFGEGAPRFEWTFVGAAAGPVRTSNGLDVPAQEGLREAPFDLVFVPAAYYRGRAAFGRWLRAQRPAAAWLRRQHRAGAVLATYGAGSFLLGEAGLLDGRAAATSWWLERQFRERYPRARLESTELITDDERIVCAGAPALMLYLVVKLVERFMSPGIALRTVRATQIDLGHAVHSPYLHERYEAAAEDPLVNAARYRMQRSLAHGPGVAALAAELGVSQSTLIRRFKRTLGVSPQMFQQGLRVEAARQWLETSRLPLDEIIARVGYSDVSSFTRLFQQRVGMTPGAYRQRYGEPGRGADAA